MDKVIYDQFLRLDEKLEVVLRNAWSVKFYSVSDISLDGSRTSGRSTWRYQYPGIGGRPPGRLSTKAVAEAVWGLPEWVWLIYST